MLISAAARHDAASITHQTLAWFLAEGQEWSEPVEIGEPNFWMWRVTWHHGTAYGTAYSTVAFISDAGTDGLILRFYKSRDGISFEPVVSELLTENRPNESTLVFDGDRLLCLTRHEAGPALIGQSLPPYTDWKWQDLGMLFGGPDFCNSRTAAFWPVDVCIAPAAWRFAVLMSSKASSRKLKHCPPVAIAAIPAS